MVFCHETTYVTDCALFYVIYSVTVKVACQINVRAININMLSSTNVLQAAHHRLGLPNKNPA